MKKILWLTDFKTSDHIGGAELVNDILIGYRPSDFDVHHVYVNALTKEILDEINPDFLIVDSITRISSIESAELIASIFDRVPFFSLEHDYNKITRFRHHFQDGDNFLVGDDNWCKFYHYFWQHKNRKKTFFMSHGQKNLSLSKVMDAGLTLNNEDETICVMSSCIYSKEDLEFIDNLNRRRKSKENYYLIFDTKNPLKGTKQSIDFAQLQDIPYKLFSNLTPKQLLVEFSKAQGIVYMPTMHDVCPRITVEPILLGGTAITNSFSQHKDEEWFTNGQEQCRKYVESRPDYFWNSIRECL